MHCVRARACLLATLRPALSMRSGPSGSADPGGGGAAHQPVTMAALAQCRMVRSSTVEFVESRVRTAWQGHDGAYPMGFPPENESHSEVSLWQCKTCSYQFYVSGKKRESSKRAGSVKKKRKLAACSCGEVWSPPELRPSHPQAKHAFADPQAEPPFSVLSGCGIGPPAQCHAGFAPGTATPA